MSPGPEREEFEALVQGYLDGSLADSESRRLLELLRRDPSGIQGILDGLQMDFLIRKVVAESELENLSLVTPSGQRGVCVDGLVRPLVTRIRWPKVVSLAAAVLFLLSLGAWLLSPKMGEPVLAEVVGEVRLERIGQTPAAASANTPLKPGDLLLTASNAKAVIEFGTERTDIDLGPQTALQLVSSGSRKRFDLRTGRLEAEVARQRPFAPLVVTTPNAAATVIGTRFSLTATTNRTRLDVAEGRVQLVDTINLTNKPVAVGAGESAQVGPGILLAALPQTGGLMREYWIGVSRETLDVLPFGRPFPSEPTGRELLQEFESIATWTNSGAVRLRGFIHPPSTGDYRFWIASSGPAYLFLSPDDDPVKKKRELTGGGQKLHEWAPKRGLGNGSRYQSDEILLMAGRRYFVEVIQIAAEGESHLSVAWTLPDGKRAVIAREFLSPPQAGK